MKKYRKKPIVVEAVQWDGEFNDVVKAPLAIMDNDNINEYGNIKTFNRGKIWIKKDDYIIKENGEYYPVKPEIFEQTYEKIS